MYVISLHHAIFGAFGLNLCFKINLKEYLSKANEYLFEICCTFADIYQTMEVLENAMVKIKNTVIF